MVLMSIYTKVIVGHLLQCFAEANYDCFLYMFSFTSVGKIAFFFPNLWSGECFINANVRREVPNDDDDFVFPDIFSRRGVKTVQRAQTIVIDVKPHRGIEIHGKNVDDAAAVGEISGLDNLASLTVTKFSQGFEDIVKEYGLVNEELEGRKHDLNPKL